VGDPRDILGETAEIGSTKSRRCGVVFYYWVRLIAFLALIVCCVSVTISTLSEADRDKRLEELNRLVGEQRSELARTNAALAEVARARQKDVEAYRAQLKDNQQNLTQLEAQAQEISSIRAEIPSLRAKVTSIEKAAKRLTGEFVKSLLAAGATPSTPSYASGPNKLKLPPELEKLSPDLTEATTKSRCLLTLNGFALICDLNSPGSQQ